MKPNIVVDVGNTRIKWGRCANGRVVEMVSLAPDQPLSWEEQVKLWNPASTVPWAIAGVHPEREHQLVAWLQQHGYRLLVLQDKTKLPIKVDVPIPQVGTDRLLNAVAAKNRVQREISIFIVDAGSAVTVDWVDEQGAFRGGAIFPGIQMMARALHEQTAALPLVNMFNVLSHDWNPPLPATSTTMAIAGGVYWAVAGGIKALVRQMAEKAGASRHRAVFLTGGDALCLKPVLDSEYGLWPSMTLEGILLAAEALP